jgi:hypothetical protein
MNLNCEEEFIQVMQSKKIENVRSLSGRGAVGAHNNVFLEQLQECAQYVCPANEN